MTSTFEIGTDRALISAVSTTRNRIAYVVGAPFSSPDRRGALGVPGVDGMLALVRAALSKNPEARQAVTRALKEVDPARRYQLAMGLLSTWTSQDVVNEVVRDAVLSARIDSERKLMTLVDYEKDLAGWYITPATASLAQIAVEFPKSHGGPILTTNFDPLISVAINRVGGVACRVVLDRDGGLSGHQVDTDNARWVVHLHGYWRDSDTLHSSSQLTAKRPRLHNTLLRILTVNTVLVVGYSGWDDAFTDALASAAADDGAGLNIIWAFRDTKKEDILGKYENLLKKVSPLIIRGRFRMYGGVDCHKFFPDLHMALSLAASTPPVDITERLRSDRQANRITTAHAIGSGQWSTSPSRQTVGSDMLDAFMGREADVSQVGELCSANRLVTIFGVGGVGKTRLALEVVASRPANEAWGNIVICRLDGLTNSGLVVNAVAHSLGVTPTFGQSMTEALTEYLRDRKVLLVLDTCEHVIEGVTNVAMAILGQCPRVRILATSRKRLHVPGEHIWSLSGLGVPESDDASLDEVRSAASCALFLNRAGLSMDSAMCDIETARAVAAICRHLDGLPLAIELAAGWVGTLSPVELSRQLRECLSLDVPGTEIRPVRHRTLQKCVDWSYGLLTSSEQQVLRRLAVFAGGALLPAVTSVCLDETKGSHGGLGVLAKLVDLSLVQTTVHGHSSRYQLLDTIREYGLNRLSTTGELEQTRIRHAEYFLTLAIESERSVHGPGASAYVQRLEDDINNFRVAMTYYLNTGQREAALEFASMYWFWFLKGYWAEMCPLLETELESAAEMEPRLRAKALLAVGTMHWARGALDTANSRLTEAVQTFKALGDDWGINQVLHIHGHVAHQRGELDQALSYFERSLKYWRAADDAYWLALVLNDVGAISTDLGSSTTALPVLQEALSLAISISDQQAEGNALNSLGLLSFRSGRFDEARTYYERAVTVLKQLGYERGLATTLRNLGNLLLQCGDSEAASDALRQAVSKQLKIRHIAGLAKTLIVVSKLLTGSNAIESSSRLLGASSAMRDMVSAPLCEIEQLEHDRLVTELQSRLSGAVFAKLWREGEALDLRSATTVALSALGSPQTVL